MVFVVYNLIKSNRNLATSKKFTMFEFSERESFNGFLYSLRFYNHELSYFLSLNAHFPLFI